MRSLWYFNTCPLWRDRAVHVKCAGWAVLDWLSKAPLAKQRVIVNLQLHFIFLFFWLFSVGLHNVASSLFVSIFADAAVVFKQTLVESSLVQTDTTFIPSLLATETPAAASCLPMFSVNFLILILLDCLVWLQQVSVGLNIVSTFAQELLLALIMNTVIFTVAVLAVYKQSNVQDQ